MENEPDLSGVDPVRWPEIRRRVAILDEFVALRRPSAGTRSRYAERLGLSGSQFLHLARVWRIKRDPASIPGARSRIAVKRRPRLPAASTQVAREVIDDLGPFARRRDVLAAVAERSRSAGVSPPSDTTVTKMLAAARTQASPADHLTPELLIDGCSVKLPVVCGEEVVMPRVLVAVALPERRIVAADIGFGPERPPSLTRLMERVRTASVADGTPLRVRAPHVTSAERASIGAIPPEHARNLPTLARLLGDRISDLGIIHQEGKARHARSLVGARHASPLAPADAVRAIDDAIAAHNRGVPAIPPAGFSLPGRTVPADARSRRAGADQDAR